MVGSVFVIVFGIIQYLLMPLTMVTSSIFEILLTNMLT